MKSDNRQERHDFNSAARQGFYKPYLDDAKRRTGELK